MIHTDGWRQSYVHRTLWQSKGTNKKMRDNVDKVQDGYDSVNLLFPQRFTDSLKQFEKQNHCVISAMNF